MSDDPKSIAARLAPTFWDMYAAAAPSGLLANGKVAVGNSATLSQMAAQHADALEAHRVNRELVGSRTE